MIPAIGSTVPLCSGFKYSIFVFQLLYFSAASHAQEGFMRALSVASGIHMPRIPKAVFKTESVPNRYGKCSKISTSVSCKNALANSGGPVQFDQVRTVYSFTNFFRKNIGKFALN